MRWFWHFCFCYCLSYLFICSHNAWFSNSLMSMRQLMLSTRSKMRQSKEKIIKKLWKNQQKQNNCILIATFWPEHYTVEGEKLSDRSDFWSIFSSILLCTKANLSTLSAIFHQKWLINGRKRECFKIEWKIYTFLSLTFFRFV